MRTLNRVELIALGLLTCAGVAGIAQAQTGVTDATKPTNNAGAVRTNQNVVGAGAGTGTEQGQSAATVSGKGQPAVGVGAGSGQVQHFGSKGSVSAGNNARLLGVDGPGGYNSPTSASVRNPAQKPAVNGAQDTTGTTTSPVPH